MSLKAAIYLRQSIDAKEGIDRQRQRTKALVKAKGWKLVREYADNSTSASKDRSVGTDWARLLESIRSGDVQVVVAVDLDRLLRRTQELNLLIDLGAKVVTVDGEIDLSTADGEFRATMLASIARFEVRRKSERQKRANEHRVQEGKRTGASRRPFGFAKDGTTVIEAEAAAIRAGYHALLSGVALAAIARDWNARGIATTQLRQARSGHAGEPSPWSGGAVRSVLANPRNAGIVTYSREFPHPTDPAKTIRVPEEVMSDDGTPVTAEWPAIVSIETFRAAASMLADPGRRTSRPRYGKYLLSGLAKCGVEGCDGHAHAGGNARRGKPGYRCSASAGHFSRMSEPVELYIRKRVIERMSEEDARDLLLKKGPDVKALRREAIAVERRLENLTELVAEGTFTLSQARAASEKLRTEGAEIEAKIADAGRVDVLGPIVDAGEVAKEAAAAVWDAWDVDRRRAALDILMEVTLYPTGRGVRLREDDPRLKATVWIDWKDEREDAAIAEFPEPIAPVTAMIPKPTTAEVAALLADGWDRHRLADRYGRPVRTVDKWIGDAYAHTRRATNDAPRSRRR